LLVVRGLIVLLVFFVVLINQMPFCLPRSCSHMGGAFFDGYFSVTGKMAARI